MLLAIFRLYFRFGRSLCVVWYAVQCIWRGGNLPFYLCVHICCRQTSICEGKASHRLNWSVQFLMWSLRNSMWHKGSMDSRVHQIIHLVCRHSHSSTAACHVPITRSSHYHIRSQINGVSPGTIWCLSHSPDKKTTQKWQLVEYILIETLWYRYKDIKIGSKYRYRKLPLELSWGFFLH